MNFNSFLYSILFFSFILISCDNKKKEESPIYVNQSLHAEFVGKAACIECHQKEFKEWKGSHHDKAMMVANDSTVLGDFNEAKLQRNGRTHRLYKKDGTFYALTDDEKGAMREFEIRYTFGFSPIQQYLVDFGQGRLQVLALTWDDQKKEWFYMADEVYKGQSVTHENWLHWTNQAQNWNGMCAECHMTNLKKNYDPVTDSYQTTWSEINVSCEACHGPSSEHLVWAKESEEKKKKWKNSGFQKASNPSDHKEFVENCARCHARRSIFEDYHYQWKDPFDHMVPSTVASSFYHSDGQIKEEDYVYGSFLQSKMYQEGVRCNDCHNVHSTQLKLQGNQLCAQCHADETYNTEKHHHHTANTEGAQCVNCHMPGQYFMGRDFRRDHNFRVPRPDVSKRVGSPDACTQCHTGQSVDWAIKNWKTWYGEPKEKHHGITFHEADLRIDSVYDELKNIVENQRNPLMVRRTGIELMGRNYPQKNEELVKYLSEKESALRYQGVSRINVNENNVQKVLPLLTDSVKAIRAEAALTLSKKQNLIPADYKESFHKALKEYIAIEEYNYDFPVAKMNLGNLYYNLGDYDKAITYFKGALQQDAELYVAQLNLAYLYHKMGNIEEAVKVFKEYLAHNEEDGNTFYEVGLLLAEKGNYEEATVYLEKAKTMLKEERITLNLAKIYAYLGNDTTAEKYFKSLIQDNSEALEYHMALLEFYVQKKKVQKAKQEAKEIIQKFPDYEGKEALENFVNQP